MRLLLAAIFLLQAAPAQSEADKLEAALKRFGDRRYKILQDGQGSGSMTLRARIEKDGDGKAAVIEVGLTAMVKDFAVSLKFTEKASLDGCRLISAKMSGRDPVGDIDCAASVREATASITAKNKTHAIEVTERTVGELAPLVMACTTDQKVGASFKVDVLRMVTQRLEKGREFTCVAKETVEIAGRKFDAFKWEERWVQEGPKDGAPIPAKVETTYWVSPDGYVLRTLGSQGMEVVLDAK